MFSRFLTVLVLVSLHTACAPSEFTGGSMESRDSYLSIVHSIPEPTVTPTPKVVSFPARVSFYSNSVEEGTNGRTALGQPTSRGMVAVAYTLDENGRAIPVIPFGTQVRLEGLGVYTIADTCPACEENWFDVYTESREEAFRLGVRYTSATIERER